MKKTLLAVAIGAAMFAGNASASTFTSTSSFGFDVTTVGASTVGGVVAQLVGTNGASVVSQLSASSLYLGYAGSNPFTVGEQTGFSAATLAALGGGISKAAFRFSLSDGDSATGDFDQNDNTLLVNGLSFGNWTAVQAQNTNGSGVVGGAGFSGGGFRNGTLDTGWFSSTDGALMASLYASLTATNKLVFNVNDVDPYDNYYDFTQGIDQSLINVGQGPVITPPTNNVPEPESLALLGLGLAGLAASRRRKLVAN